MKGANLIYPWFAETCGNILSCRLGWVILYWISPLMLEYLDFQLQSMYHIFLWFFSSASIPGHFSWLLQHSTAHCRRQWETQTNTTSSSISVRFLIPLVYPPCLPGSTSPSVPPALWAHRLSRSWWMWNRPQLRLLHYPMTIYYPLSVGTINPGPGNRDLSVLHYQDLPMSPSLPVTWCTHTHTHVSVCVGFLPFLFLYMARCFSYHLHDTYRLSLTHTLFSHNHCPFHMSFCSLSHTHTHTVSFFYRLLYFKLRWWTPRPTCECLCPDLWF